MKGVFIFLANGFEEIEALATIDILRRADVDVTTVSIHQDKYVIGAHKIPVVADLTYGEFKANIEFGDTLQTDVMIFPGGMPGTKNLAEKTELINLMRLHYAEGGTVAAICAAPGLVVSQLSNISGKQFTCYDGFENELIAKGGVYKNEACVVDGNLITGRGPGCAIQFATAILTELVGETKANEIYSSLLC